MTVQLYHGDCHDILPTLGLPMSDLTIITDPPYGTNYNPQRKRVGTQVGRNRSNWSSVSWKRIQNDDRSFDPSHLLDYPRIVLWGANHYASRLPDSGGWLFWDKDQANGFTGSDGELAWTNILNTVKKFEYMWSGFRRAGEVGEYYHPTQKPVALMAWCIELATSEGDIIIDPYMGSGTTGVACVQTYRNFIGIEIDEGYFDIAQTRIKAVQEEMVQAVFAFQ